MTLWIFVAKMQPNCFPATNQVMNITAFPSDTREKLSDFELFTRTQSSTWPLSSQHIQWVSDSEMRLGAVHKGRPQNLTNF